MHRMLRLVNGKTIYLIILLPIFVRQDEKIYCVASGGLYYVNKEDMTINRMSKITGLSDVGVKQSCLF